MSYSWCANGCTGAGCSRRLSIASFILILVGILVAFITEPLSISFVPHHVGSASCPRGNHSLLVPRSWATSVFFANLHVVWQLPHSRQHELGFHPLGSWISLMFSIALQWLLPPRVQTVTSLSRFLSSGCSLPAISPSSLSCADQLMTSMVKPRNNFHVPHLPFEVVHERCWWKILVPPVCFLVLQFFSLQSLVGFFSCWTHQLNVLVSFLPYSRIAVVIVSSIQSPHGNNYLWFLMLRRQLSSTQIPFDFWSPSAEIAYIYISLSLSLLIADVQGLVDCFRKLYTPGCCFAY